MLLTDYYTQPKWRCAELNWNQIILAPHSSLNCSIQNFETILVKNLKFKQLFSFLILNVLSDVHNELSIQNIIF